MKRAEIAQKILETFNDDTKYQCIVDELTDLFIQLSEERCKEQKQEVVKELNDALQCITTHDEQIDIILNAPFPTLD